ncbi:MAG TPA: cation:proton antiporter [Bacilli bacterium]|nr:cation:proton antiporter [Bacilli bacterium]
MLLSLGLILSLGFLGGFLFSKIRIPGLVAMIIVGLIIGPYMLNLIDASILNISAELRQIALIIILTRSGFNLDLASLKKIGRPAILMSFIPATLEIIGIMIFSHLLLDLSLFEGMLLGSVIAAVSPAVVSPRMINLIEKGYGSEKAVPKLVLAGSSVDDIYVIILFYTFLGLVETNVFIATNLVSIPFSIGLGIIFGLMMGLVLSFILKKTTFPLVINMIIILATSFLMVGLENILKPYVAVSSLLGIIVLAMTLLFFNSEKVKNISKGYDALWQVFEIILFVLVGATLNLNYALSNMGPSLLVLLAGLTFRAVGVGLSLLLTNYNYKERLFIMLAYIPKAAVQASIGGIALSMNLASGQTILTVSIIAILITAPIGAFLIDFLAPRLLKKKEEDHLLIHGEPVSEQA